MYLEPIKELQKYIYQHILKSKNFEYVRYYQIEYIEGKQQQT